MEKTQTMELMVENDRRKEGLHIFWLIEDGVTVAYMKAQHEQNDGSNRLYLYDIEVRNNYRGLGLSTEIMNQACELFNVEKISHTGGYTPDGFERIFGRVHYAGYETVTQAMFDPMTFVEDWDKRWGKF